MTTLSEGRNMLACTTKTYNASLKSLIAEVPKNNLFETEEKLGAEFHEVQTPDERLFQLI
jgi:hypothetical protein